MQKTTPTEVKGANKELSGVLTQLNTKFGFTPNIMRVLGSSAATLQSYIAQAEWSLKTSFSPLEKETISLAVSIENKSDYCVAMHSMTAIKKAGMSTDVLDAIRTGSALKDARLNELVLFTREIVRERGHLGAKSVEKFRAAGFTDKNVLEVVQLVAMETLSNYTNLISKIELDPELKEFRWIKH